MGLMGNASLDGIDGGASLDGEFSIYPIYPIRPIRPIRLIRLIRLIFPIFPIFPKIHSLSATNKKRRPESRLKFCFISGGQDWHRYARPTSFTIISKPNVMHHYIGIFLVISVLQVNMHTLITKKDSLLRVLHYITLDAEGTGFEPADTLRYRQFSKLLV